MSGIRLIKIINFFLVAGIFIGSVYYFAHGDNFTGTAGLISILVVFIPHLLYYKLKWVKEDYNENLPLFIKTLVVIAVSLNALGAKGAGGLYYTGMEYDGLLHFIISAILFFIFWIFYLVYKGVEHPPFKISAVSFIGIFTLGWAVIWEFFEKYGDMIWGTIMFSEPGQPIDTFLDILFDIGGVLFAIALGYLIMNKLMKLWVRKR